MTGYGYNSNLVQQVQQPQVLQGVNEEWTHTTGQSQYYHTDSGATGLSNPMLYGSGWYQPPNYNNYPAAPEHNVVDQQRSPPDAMDNTRALAYQNQMFMMQAANLAPPPQPRVSFSDEELYQALNMSPLPPTATFHALHQQQQQQQQHQSMKQQHAMHLQQQPQTDYLSSEVCYPSTSSYEPSGYNESGYCPQNSTILPDDPQNYQHGNDGDDEESFGEPERYEPMSPTFSIHSFAPTTSTNTAEAEDLEVELINNHKPTPRYQLSDDIDIFLHTGTTDDTEYNDDSDSRPTTTFSHRSTKAPTPPASRPAYAQKFTAAAQNLKPEQQQPTTSDITSPISKTSPLFLQTTGQDPAGFTPLLTPNSDALLQKKLSEVVHNPPQRAIGLSAFPAFPQQPPHLTRFQENQRYEGNFVEYQPPPPQQHQQQQPQAPEGFYPPISLNTRYDYDSDRDILPLLLDTFQPLPAPPQIPPVTVSVPVSVPELLTSTKKPSQPAKVPAAPIKAPRLSDQELESESQKLALDVISNLFSNKKEIIDRAAVLSAPKKPVARNLFCNDPESLEKAKSSEPLTMSVLDDWETADDDDLTVRMENLLKDKKKEEKKAQSMSKAPPPPQRNSDWDTAFLQHVLEIYGVPDYKMQEDVVKAMETIGNGDCKVMWMERKVVFAVFESVNRAKNCLTLSKHDWLRFRSLADSPKVVQDSAKTNAASLGILKKKQQTTATVARRMVENALGKKATVSTEKRQEERKQLAAAKAAKKNTIQWD
ncbi:C3H1-type domain-containing protein [Caenorhabditis elegans]|uniref:C3H1-type domain-containing protein n=1 Tax=Caenorhabditis elegans TaxID=6239 RepID=O01299_CAEEL|nr:C3H1-type domain-containing protein [Caenorhabditis elegans]CAA92220.2 C3H1-type domain-containing protein [Caenorhabditis elegans]|eukprot:NP_510635.2 Uncharacterized protein CELE_F09C8.2 [Caenorhabditis elegans]